MDRKVVFEEKITSEILMLRMEDRVSKNTFSKELIEQLEESFERIRNDDVYKVVIMTGYDNYFCSGGTMESLLAINQGKEKFTDKNIYSLALECDIPVISAMQGHGIGGGFVMGLFADFVVLGKECVYTTNFMKYGFTPGMGATCVVPKKLGIALGEEMLLNAGTYRGPELEKRGVPYPVLPKAEVVGYAIELAKQLAEKPRLSLITLKKHLVSDIRNELPAYIEKEIEMHEITFHQPIVEERIKQLFGR